MDMEEIIKLKEIFDKLGKYYILDDIVFNSAEATVNLLTAVYEVDFWKIEKDGSVNLKSMHGHNGGFKYKKLSTDGLPEINSESLRWMNNRLNINEIKILANWVNKIV